MSHFINDDINAETNGTIYINTYEMTIKDYTLLIIIKEKKFIKLFTN